jgi:ABC-type phosphate/phosphonate transport system substrate-binding protein
LHVAYRLNATGLIHWGTDTYVFMNQTVTPNPTVECIKESQEIPGTPFAQREKLAGDGLNSIVQAIMYYCGKSR